MAYRKDAPPIEPDPRAISELIATLRALFEIDDDDDEHYLEYTDLYDALRHKPPDEVFTAARDLCHSTQTIDRAVGVRIVPEKHTETFNLLAECLRSEQDEDVLRGIIYQLGHNHDARAVALVTPFGKHLNADVRYAVTSALSRYEDPQAIDTLIALSADEDTDIRDWATFGLGTLTEVDIPALREALLARIEDEDFETRSEAYVGLAYRKDARIVEPLLRDMAEGVSYKTCEALSEILEFVDPQHPLLVAAIDRCKRGERWPDRD